METIPTNCGPMSAAQLVDALLYSSYAYNRSLGMSAEQLAKLFPATGAAMEAKYQEES